MAPLAADDPARPIGGAGLIGASPRSILAFAARTLAWCIPVFAAWYFAAQPISLAAGWLSARMLDLAGPVEGTRIEWRDDHVAFVLSPDSSTKYQRRLRDSVTFEVPLDVRKQTYGLAFFIALLLAARSRRLALKAAIGCTVLLVFASIGIACEVVIGYASLALPGGARLFSPGSTIATLIALGFQLGTLIFPSVAPVALWAGLDALRRSE